MIRYLKHRSHATIRLLRRLRRLERATKLALYSSLVAFFAGLTMMALIMCWPWMRSWSVFFLFVGAACFWEAFHILGERLALESEMLERYLDKIDKE